MIKTGTYKFIGTNSLGFIHGEIYDLIIESNHFGLTDPVTICSKHNHSAGKCVYGSIVAFWKNWIDRKPIRRTYSEIDPYGEEVWED